jgi:phosphohistidine phosphatase
VRSLYLLRHAKSSWDDPALADHERPLAPRGRRDGKLIAAHLRSKGIAPELVLCSSAARTQVTLESIRPALGDAAVSVEDGLYGASAHELLGRLRAVPDEAASVLVIGHNPGLHELALALAAPGGERDRLREKFPTAALATLELPGDWASLAPGAATLAAYVVPKELR